MILSRRIYAVIYICLMSLQLACACLPRSSFPSLVQSIISKPEYAHSVWGISILHKVGSSHETFYEHKANEYFLPASNNKVVTTAPAFLTLGANFTVKTSFYGTANRTYPSKLDRLCIVGQGDPTRTTKDLNEALKAIVERGYTQIDSLELSDPNFPLFPDTWEYSDLAQDYGAQPTSLTLNQNAFKIVASPTTVNSRVKLHFVSPEDAACIQIVNEAITTTSTQPTTLDAYWRPGSQAIFITGQLPINLQNVTKSFGVMDPFQYYGCVAKYLLNKLGVSVSTVKTSRCNKDDNDMKLFEMSSSPFAEITNTCLQDSNNLFAEFCLHALGSTLPGNPHQNGLLMVKKVLQAYGVDTEDFYQADGSGLSRRNMVTPRGMTSLLKMLTTTQNFNMYKSFLPVAGKSGTLKDRFVNTPAEGIVHAKTGSMTGVISLSGYIDSAEGWIFSILVNKSTQSAAYIRESIDKIVLGVIDLCPAN